MKKPICIFLSVIIGTAIAYAMTASVVFFILKALSIAFNFDFGWELVSWTAVAIMAFNGFMNLKKGLK